MEETAKRGTRKRQSDELSELVRRAKAMENELALVTKRVLELERLLTQIKERLPQR